MTATGRGLAAAAAAVYAAGVALDYPELLVLAAAAAALIAIAGVLVARRPAQRLSRLVHPDRVTVGGRASALVTVANRSRRPSPPFVATDRVDGAEVSVAVPPIAAHGTVRVRYDLPTTRRGRLALGPVTASRRDPFGLVHRDQEHALEGVLWVHPRVHRLAPFPAGVALDVEGPLADLSPRGSVTFSSLRDYVPGDDVRQIHWPSVARTGTLLVREHVDTSQPRLTVALDVRAAAWAGADGVADAAFEHGAEVAASLAVAAERAGHPLTLVVGEAARAPDGQAARTLDRLALAAPTATGGGRLLGALERVPSGGVLVVVTGARRRGGGDGELAGLRRRFALVVAVHVVPRAAPGLVRRAGMVSITTPSGRRFADQWNRLVTA